MIKKFLKSVEEASSTVGFVVLWYMILSLFINLPELNIEQKYFLFIFTISVTAGNFWRAMRQK